jgi:hypothetical protein
VVETWTGDRLAAQFRRYAGGYAEGVIDAPGFVATLLANLGWTAGVLPDLAPALWASVPGDLRGQFAAALRAALAPGFAAHNPLRYGGPPDPPEVRRREGERRTAVVRAWAVELLRVLPAVEPDAEPGAAPDPARIQGS